MKPETLKALRESIQKWEDIVAGKRGNMGTRDCALCQRFRSLERPCARVSRLDEIEECPVFIRSGEAGCRGTPYYSFVGAARYNDEGKWIGNFTDAARDVVAAKAEADFLRSLLPKDQKP